MKISSKIAKENVARLNTAIHFIEENLSEKLSLELIAEKAHYSPFHFHRLFKIIVNETVHNFINRKRIEKAASYLLHQKEINSTEIAEKVGFSNLSSFSKSFKKFYGISPNKFKEKSLGKFSKISKTESKNGKVTITFEQYICNINNALNWLKMKTSPEIKHIEKLELAYIAHKGEMEKIGEVFNRLIRWATPKGLMSQENVRLLTIYHDSPKITSPENIRSSIAIVLNSKTSVEGEVSLKAITPKKCIVSRLEITPNEFQQAWESSFAYMIENGYKKSEVDPFEIYYNNAAEHPENKFIVDLCIPIL